MPRKKKTSGLPLETQLYQGRTNCPDPFTTVAENAAVRKKDLVSLVWPTNTCYSTLIAGVPKDVTIDLKSGTWTFQGHVNKIGARTSVLLMKFKGYPIGVYDRTKIKHLEQMKQDAEWVRTRNNPSGD